VASAPWPSCSVADSRGAKAVRDPPADGEADAAALRPASMIPTRRSPARSAVTAMMVSSSGTCPSSPGPRMMSAAGSRAGAASMGGSTEMAQTY
jgi:hypothetical protein